MGEIMLEDLLKGLQYTLLNGTSQHHILHISKDSRIVGENDLFVCMKGYRTNTHELLEDVYLRGCRCIVVSEDIQMKEGITYIYVKDSQYAWAMICRNYFHHTNIKLIGVTGTKGKTSVCQYLYTLINKTYKCGLICGLGIECDEHIDISNSTPDAYIIHQYLEKMDQLGYSYCVIEVSSLSVYYKRIEGLYFDIGILTNISEDHIGGYEHPDFESYVNCKIDFLKKCQFILMNNDECQNISDKLNGFEYMSYGINKNSDFKASHIIYSDNTMCFEFNNDHIIINKLGLFHVYNILSVLSVCQFLNIKYDKEIDLNVSGRYEFIDNNQGLRVLIDYAHNCYSYKVLLDSMKHYSYHRLICVYGAGGNRDKKRRYEIGKLAASYNVYSIVTMDNPRYEDVNDICNDIVEGIKENHGEYKVIIDRKEAIEYALNMACKDDIVMCLGKGNECYQIIGNEKIEFSDREMIVNYLKKM